MAITIILNSSVPVFSDLIPGHRPDVAVGSAFDTEVKDPVNTAPTADHAVPASEQATRAENELIESHLPLVRATAMKFYSKAKDFVELDDLIGAGSEGLVVAARRFDQRLGCKFSTYALWWIRNKVLEELRHQRWVMQIPDRTYRRVLKLWNVTSNLRREFRRQPTEGELAKRMNIPIWQIRKLLMWARQELASLDMPVGEDEVSTLADFITEDHRLGRSTEGEDLVERGALRGALLAALEKLSVLEREVLTQHYGLNSERAEATPEEIGRSLRRTPHNVGQIEGKALRKLRGVRHSKKLLPFVR
jgi:RNA polymerase primary sigma factor